MNYLAVHQHAKTLHIKFFPAMAVVDESARSCLECNWLGRKEEKASRECLNCGRNFVSKSVFNRQCEKCKALTEYVDTYSPVYTVHSE